MKRYILFLAFGLFAAACGSIDDNLTGSSATPAASAAPDTPQIGTWVSAVKIDPDTGADQTCTGPDDLTCNWQGPGQRLACDADLKCRYYQSDDNCTYPGLEGGPMTCTYAACADDNDCNDSDPNTGDTCIFTDASFASDSGPGVCFHPYAICTALSGTPCQESGVTYCTGGVCACTVDGDLTKATSELCDAVDNDCDASTDEGFSLGTTCDGQGDTDLCMNGTLTCAADQLGTECVNEAPSGVVELCNELDDDCDGAIDETFPTLGNACDGNDADLCANGTLVCMGDGSGVTCNEVGMNVTEVCNELDDDCDGVVDEGCDDDNDGYCDSAMLVAAGASCTSGDCDDEDEDVHPEASELCNSVDDDCDVAVDEGFDLGGVCFAGLGICMGSGTYNACAADGMSAVCSAQANPNQQISGELCNGQDDDCDGVVDEGCDDDNDGWCDSTMLYGAGAACAEGDCDDTSPVVNPAASEICNGLDDDCDGVVDEGCDDDNDGWCDLAMLVGAGATCNAGDCNDTNGDINPGMEEQCITVVDDNCDGDTEFLADGQTPACDSCANARMLECDEDYVINMATEPNAFNAIDSYTCWTKAGKVKTIGATLSAPDVVIVPDADPGTEFSLLIKTTGTGTIAALLNGSCDPNEGTSAVTAYHPPEHNGTCALYSTVSVDGGVVGEHFVVLDATSAKTVTVRFVCD